MKRTKKIREANSDRALNRILYGIFVFYILIILYPLIYVVSSSFSSGSAVTSGKVVLFPVDFSTTGYQLVFKNSAVWTGFRNSVLYTVVGTSINMLLTIMTAYPLSRKDLPYRKIFTIFFIIPLFFSGGLVPSYILMTRLHLNNTMWAYILSGTLNIFNMILMRTYFQNSIPEDLHDAAQIDGVSDIGYLLKVVLPLSKPIIAVITLYYAVSHWNSYFDAMIYFRDRDLYPLQLVLRSLLQSTTVNMSEISEGEVLAKMIGAADLIKYAMVVVSTVPIMIIYPFVQKHFKKGVMIGSVKG